MNVVGNLPRESYLGGALRVEVEPKYWICREGTVYSEKSKRLLKIQESYRGYLCIKLSNSKWHLVHRLVGAAFVQGRTEERNQINHIDGVKTNNNFENLEWVTGSENMIHAVRTGLQPPTVWTPESIEKRSQSHRGRKCTEEQKSRMAEARKGKGRQPKSPETRKKISDALKRGSQ